MSGGDYSDHKLHLQCSNSSVSEGGGDLEAQSSPRTPGKTISDLLKRLDRGFSDRRLSSLKRSDRGEHSSSLPSDHGVVAGDEVLGDSAPPEWALLLLGCLLGLATGLCVAAFNRGVHVIHEWAWAGTPNEGAAWLRLQRLADTWHRILLIPVLGGVVVGVLHGLVEILDQIKQSSSSSQGGQGIDLFAGIFPTVKAIQAAITLGTGCSLGPEGPSVDIGKSCAHGCSVIMENNRERRIALVAAGAAAGISSGFNAAVAGCFFAIETVLRPLRAENSPPFTTAMIILASVISSTVSNAVLGEKQAFTVPTYDLKSAAELPLYLILGMLCGVVSVAFTRLVDWFSKGFKFLREKFGLPDVVCPALGGLGAGIIALKYPGVLYWGFTNVDEILHTGKTASAPGIWLLAQLSAAKVIATALCKGSGLVGGLYAPSLMIGAAVGAVFGGFSVELINYAIPGSGAIAQPQAYALVGMAATLASVCSVPLTSVLLLFELTKDYRILLPLMGAVGLAIWVPSVTNQHKDTETSDSKKLSRGYSILSHDEDENDGSWPKTGGRHDLELSIIGNGNNHETIDEDFVLENMKVSQAMSKDYLKLTLNQTVKEALKCMHDGQQHCALVVDSEGYLEGILTYGDIKRSLFKNSGDSLNMEFLHTDVYTELAMAKQLMEAKGIKQLPVVKRGRDIQKERKRRVIAILNYGSIWDSIRKEVNWHKSAYQQARGDNSNQIVPIGL
nr:chloride channel protein CLC-f [Ipomoea trifida]